MNYKFANLLGAPYRGGNVILHGSELLSPVGNRVSQVCSAARCDQPVSCSCCCSSTTAGMCMTLASSCGRP
jgi:hypothetical protein